jgi:hypothetical protein
VVDASAGLDTKLVKHEVRVVKNVTISMDDDTLAWVRIEAAKAGTSVSRWIAARLRSEHLDDEGFAADIAAIEEVEQTLRLPLSDNGRIRIDRDEMYGHLLHRHVDAALPARRTGAGESGDLQGVAEPPAPRAPSGDEPSGSQ